MDNDQEEVSMPQTELNEILSREIVEDDKESIQDIPYSKEIKEEFDNSDLFDD